MELVSTEAELAQAGQTGPTSRDVHDFEKRRVIVAVSDIVCMLESVRRVLKGKVSLSCETLAEYRRRVRVHADACT